MFGILIACVVLSQLIWKFVLFTSVSSTELAWVYMNKIRICTNFIFFDLSKMHELRLRNFAAVLPRWKIKQIRILLRQYRTCICATNDESCMTFLTAEINSLCFYPMCSNSKRIYGDFWHFLRQFLARNLHQFVWLWLKSTSFFFHHWKKLFTFYPLLPIPKIIIIIPYKN